jgi:uncharacterized protein
VTGLRFDECPSCGRRWTLPRTGCPSCGATPRRSVSSGHGSVAAVSVVHPRSGEPGEPFVLLLVDLDDGVRVMGRGVPGLVVGTRVRASVEDGLPTFGQA